MSVVATMTMCAVSEGATAWSAISSAEKRCIVRSKLRKERSSRYHSFAQIVTQHRVAGTMRWPVTPPRCSNFTTSLSPIRQDLDPRVDREPLAERDDQPHSRDR